MRHCYALLLVLSSIQCLTAGATFPVEAPTAARFLDFEKAWQSAKKHVKNFLGPRRSLPPKLELQTMKKTGITYVALGDSYAAGVGSGGARKQGPKKNDYDACCSRNGNAYPVLLSTLLGAKKFDFRACMGAVARGHANSVHEQMKHASRDADLVTVTIGGNDAGFGEMIFACLGGEISEKRCLKRVRKARRRVWTVVAWRIRTVQNELRRRFPGAMIVFTGYPLPFPDVPDDLICFSPTIRREINRFSRSLNTAIRLSAWNFVPVDFSGKELCMATSWFHDELKPAVRTPNTCSARRRFFEHVGGAYHLRMNGQLHYAQRIQKWYMKRISKSRK